MSIERVLEEPCRLSESVAWEIQRRFFQTFGPSAWADEIVPYYVTTNSYIAKCYARVIVAWVEDILALDADHGAAGIDPDEPIYVIELGAGTGRLSFLLAHELAILSQERGLPGFRVVGTDFAEANIALWPDHPDLHHAFAEGRLDGAMFDADLPGPLKLVHARETLGPSPVKNPMIAILNYVVDSLRQDAFLVHDRQLHEITVQALMPAGATRDELAPDATVELEMRRATRPVRLPYYDDPSLDNLLTRYVDTLEHAEVLIPVGAIRALRFLRTLAGGRLCVVAGDKGFRGAKDLEGRRLGGLVRSGGFSFMANFDAIGADLGGVSLTHDNRYSRFTVACFSTVDDLLPRFRGAFREHINEFGPAEYHRLFKLARASWEDPPVPLILLVLRLSGFDPTVFSLWSDRILNAVGSVSGAIRNDIGLCLDQVLVRTYAVSPKEDIRFSAGRVYYRLGRYSDAASQFSRVVADTPERSVAWYNLGLCDEHAGRRREARDHFQRATQLDPSHAQARAALERVSV